MGANEVIFAIEFVKGSTEWFPLTIRTNKGIN
jgi:hypothetical protein